MPLFEADTPSNRIKQELDEMSRIHAEICNGKPEFLLPADLKERYHSWLRSRNAWMDT